MSCCRCMSTTDITLGFATGVNQPHKMEGIFDLGIDVSKWQGDIDWGKVKASGIKFAIAKATEGSDIQDDKFLQNWRGMEAAQIKAACYHYLRGDHPSSSQVTNILSVLHSCGFDRNNNILAIDVEERRNENVTPETMGLTLKSLLEQLEDSFSHIYIYCSPRYWEQKVDFRVHDFSKYKLWIADWSGEEQPRIPETWSTEGYTWWQYSSKGKIGGISGFVDLDRSRKSKE